LATLYTFVSYILYYYVLLSNVAEKTSYAVQGTQKLFLTTTADAYLFE